MHVWGQGESAAEWRAASRREPCSLEIALADEHSLVVDSFREKYAVAHTAARSLLVETKKLLWAMARARYRGVPTPSITEELLVLDEMWHTFVLFTKLYREYCERCYGYYLDHMPATKAERMSAKHERRAAPAAFSAHWQTLRRKQAEFIYDELGSKTVVKWYRELPRRYSRATLEKLRRVQIARDFHGRGIHVPS